MNPVNLYSAVFLGLTILTLATVMVLRLGASRGRLLSIIALALVLFAAWWLVRPVQTQHLDLASLRAQIGAGKPVLLEFQSPY